MKVKKITMEGAKVTLKGIRDIAMLFLILYYVKMKLQHGYYLINRQE